MIYCTDVRLAITATNPPMVGLTGPFTGQKQEDSTKKAHLTLLFSLSLSRPLPGGFSSGALWSALGASFAHVSGNPKGLQDRCRHLHDMQIKVSRSRFFFDQSTISPPAVAAPDGTAPESGGVQYVDKKLVCC